MKKLQIIILLTVLLTACKTKNTDIVIKGTIVDKHPKEILFSGLFNNNYNSWFKKSVTPDSTGNFVISEKIEEPCFVMILYNKTSKQIILEPGKTYTIGINGKLNQINLLNRDNKAQEFFDKLPHRHPNNCDYFRQNISDYNSIYKTIKSDLSKELKELDKITCNEKVRSLIKSDRQVYYNLAISSLASRLNVSSLSKNEKTPERVMEIWEKAVSDTFIANSTTSKATYFYDLLQMELWHKTYTKLDYANFSKIRKDKREKGLIHSHNIELAKNFLPKKDIEFYTATYIQSKAKQSKYEKELINLFENFKSDFPDSKYTKYITPEINKIIDFHKKVANDNKIKYKFVEDYQDINSLNECLSHFSDKQVFIDIWSTSCGPCKKEFEYNEPLKKVLRDKNTEILYVSIDNENYAKRWKDMIKYYELEGWHLRANKTLVADLRNILGTFGTPRYLIIDKKGKIVNYDAPRPSKLEELKKHLDKI